MQDLPSERVVTLARTVLREHGYFVDNLWHISDIHFLCEQQNLPPLRDAEAMEVFTIANAAFDGEHGMSWPQLERALARYLLLQDA